MKPHSQNSDSEKFSFTYTVELASVFITVVDADLATINASVSVNVEVIWHERLAVGLKADMTLEEGTLRCSRVDLLGLSHHHRFVFKVVKDCHFSILSDLKTAFNDMLPEVTVESQDL